MLSSLLLFTSGLICFLLYILVIHAERVSNTFGKIMPPRGTSARVFAERMAGFTLMGLLSLLIITFSHQQEFLSRFTAIPPEKKTLPFFLLVIILIIFITAFYSGHEDNLHRYPQIRQKRWSAGLIAGNVVTWAFYLAAYEFLFRGVLLFSLLPVTSLPVAVIINAIVYSLAHFHKGKKEMVAAVPFGLLIAYVTVSTNSLFFAFIFHLTLALSNDFFAARALKLRSEFKNQAFHD